MTTASRSLRRGGGATAVAVAPPRPPSDDSMHRARRHRRRRRQHRATPALRSLRRGGGGDSGRRRRRDRGGLPVRVGRTNTVSSLGLAKDRPRRRQHRATTASRSLRRGGGPTAVAVAVAIEEGWGGIREFFLIVMHQTFLYIFTIHIHRHPRQHPLPLHSPQKCL